VLVIDDHLLVHSILKESLFALGMKEVRCVQNSYYRLRSSTVVEDNLDRVKVSHELGMREDAIEFSRRSISNRRLLVKSPRCQTLLYSARKPTTRRDTLYRQRAYTNLIK
jgi:hypothetical protein